MEKYVDPLDMTPDDIDILDIAHSLSLQCRFNGHSHGFYSVAAHSVLVSDYIERKLTNEGCSWPYMRRFALAGLLHDASEAYLCDIPRPLKHQEFMDGYRDAEDALLERIFAKYDCAWPMSELIHEADDAILQVEINYGRFHFDSLPKVDEQAFLRRYDELNGV